MTENCVVGVVRQHFDVSPTLPHEFENGTSAYGFVPKKTCIVAVLLNMDDSTVTFYTHGFPVKKWEISRLGNLVMPLVGLRDAFALAKVVDAHIE